MKFLSILIFFIGLISYAKAQPFSQIYSIDSDETPIYSKGLSEEALPIESIEELLYSPEFDSFTPISSERANEIFTVLKNDSRARMKSPGGYCQGRRIYFQNYLKNRFINS